MRHGQKQYLEDIIQKVQSSALKIFPFCLFPKEHISTSLEEIKIQRELQNLYQHERSVVRISFQQSLFQVVFNLGNHFGVI